MLLGSAADIRNVTKTNDSDNCHGYVMGDIQVKIKQRVCWNPFVRYEA